jgi:hypothetical protein
MKIAIITASVLALSVTPALAGGFGGSHHVSAPQFATSSALNLAVQIGKVRAGGNAKIEQVAGAAADAINKANCGCQAASQTAHASSKNVSLQLGSASSYFGKATLSQTAVSTSVAKNIRGY